MYLDAFGSFGVEVRTKDVQVWICLIHVGSLIMLIHVGPFCSAGFIQCFLVHQRAAETTSRHEVARAQGAVQNPKVKSVHHQSES